MDSDSKQPYDKYYYENIFSRQARNSQRNRSRLAIILERHERGRLLEIGCGKGEFLRLAADHFEAEGVDISAHAIETLRGTPGIRAHQFDVTQAELPAQTYDVIAAFNVFEHLPDPMTVLRKTAGALRPRGILAGSVPLNAALLGRVHTWLTNRFDPTHVSTVSPERWRDWFTEAGFRRVDFFGELVIGKNRCRYLRGPNWRYLSFNLMFRCEI